MNRLIAFLLLLFLLPLVLATSILIYFSDGRPLFYRSSRMNSLHTSFELIKFRSLRQNSNERASASGGHLDSRFFFGSRFIRRYRLDEIPQLINIIKGEMNFVGPRPPLSKYVDMSNENMQKALSVKPGLTGLATMLFHKREALLLSQCADQMTTEQVYVTRCVPKKAFLDAFYSSRKSMLLDLYIIWRTVHRVFLSR